MTVCSTCGQENPPIAKFCLACGSALAEELPPSEERRLMTALFTDIVGSTASAEAMDPEDVHQRLQPYFERTRQELERYGGTLEKYVGDAVVAVFGAPVAHEDDPERAVRAALAIRDAIHDLNEKDAWLDLSIRIGVNTGEALLVVSSNPSLDLGMAAGDAINTAARIQSAAPVNGVLVGDLTYQATRDAIEYRPAEPIAAKGKSEPVRVWEAVQALEHGGRRRMRDTQLVGRQAELELLLELWHAVGRDRLPGVAVVLGLPGVGKSRLLEEFTNQVGADGAAHWGRCLPYGEGITYWPVMDVMKSAAGILQSDEAVAIAAKLGALLESFGIDTLDELRTMATAVSNLLGVATTPRGTYQADQITQAELHWGIRRILELLARERPLAIVLEDLHWAEPTLIELVQYLAHDDAGAPLLVVASGRPETAELAPELMRERARVGVLRLEALSDEAGTALLRELLGSDELAAAPEAATLLRAAGGNPLFLEETVLALREAGLVDDEGWHLPPGTDELPTATSLQSLIGSRLDQLPRPEKRIAQHASVVGAVFWPGSVAHVQGDTAKPNGELAGHLEALEQRDFVREHEISSVAGEREYGFKHILIRDVAYGQLPKGRRIELHMRFAEWMQALPTEEFIEIVAWHLERACRLAGEVARSPVEPPIDEAVAALIRAAEKAEHREGIREAERFYIRALELVDEDHESALELRLRRARMLYVLGKADQALELLMPIADLAREAGRPDVLCEALISWAQIDDRQGNLKQAQVRLTEAQELASRSSDHRLRIRTAYALANVKGMLAAVDDAMEELSRGVSMAGEIEDRALLVEGLLRAGYLLYSMGDLVRAETELARCSELAAELGSSRDQSRALPPLSMIKYLRGDVEAAEQLGEQARSAFERTGETYFQVQNLTTLAQFALSRGDTALAEERLREALPIGLDENSWHVPEIYRLLAETLVQQDRVDDAAALAEFAARSAPEEDPYSRPIVLLAQAVVASGRGEAGRAAELYGDAVSLLTELEAPIELSQARLAYGRALISVGNDDEARDQLGRAQEACTQMGATGLLADVERELERVGSGTGLVGPAPEPI